MLIGKELTANVERIKDAFQRKIEYVLSDLSQINPETLEQSLFTKPREKIQLIKAKQEQKIEDEEWVELNSDEGGHPFIVTRQNLTGAPAYYEPLHLEMRPVGVHQHEDCIGSDGFEISIKLRHNPQYNDDSTKPTEFVYHTVVCSRCGRTKLFASRSTNRRWTIIDPEEIEEKLRYKPTKQPNVLTDP